MDTIESNLKLENEANLLKREYKYALENLTRVKSDTTDLIATKERIAKEIDERNNDLLRITNEISTEKLKWIDEKNTQIDELKEKELKADKIIERESDISKQEQKLQEIKNDTVKVRNEKRELELKLKRDMTALEVKERGIDDKIKDFEEEKKQFLLNKEDFKGKVVEILNKINEL